MFTLFLIGSIFFCCQNVEAKECYVVNNYGICISSDEYNNLLSQGFYDFEIMNMNNDIYNENKDTLAVGKTSTTRYVADTYYYVGDKVYTTSRDVTEEEYNNILPICEKVPSNTRGITNGFTETTGKRLETTIIEYTTKLRYKATLTWKVIPVTRSYDIIAVGLDRESVYASGSRTFSQTYCVTAMTCASSSIADINNQQGGVGASFELPSGSYVFMSSYLYYDVSKRSGVGTLTELGAYGDYAHATSTVTQSQAANNYVVGYGGINLYSNIEPYYDYMNKATAYWTGTWY
jgi:hypothetical protein